jgi:hypothetical protein
VRRFARSRRQWRNTHRAPIESIVGQSPRPAPLRAVEELEQAVDGGARWLP